MQKTLKIKYTTSKENKLIIRDYQRQYTSTLKCSFNEIERREGKISTKELTEYQKNLNNVPDMDSHLKNSAGQEAKQIYNSNKDKEKKINEKRKKKNKKGIEINVVFKRQNFIDRCQGKISREEFLENKYLPLYSIGESNQKGNRKFQILSESKILFKPNKDIHIILDLCNLNSNYRKELLQLIVAQNNKELPITYKLDQNNIYIIFDEVELKKVEIINKIKNRFISIDSNPNYIGWTIIDWIDSDNFNIVDKGIISIKGINDKENSLKGKSSDSKEKKYIANKRQNETIQVAIYLISLAKHYQCSGFIVEDLNITSKDTDKGRKYNKLVNNQWNRNLLYNQLNKRCDLLDIEFIKVKAEFSSFVGNMAYRKLGLPDPILASIEINRRGYEFYHQYIIKDKEKSKNIIFNTSKTNISLIIESMEELGLNESFTNIKDLYFKITKTLKLRYRVSSSFDNLKFFSLKSIKSRIILYNSI